MDLSRPRAVRLFRNGGNQAVRIPRELELPGNDALIYKEGNRLIVEPRPPATLKALLAGWSALEEGLPAVADMAPVVRRAGQHTSTEVHHALFGGSRHRNARRR